MSIEKVMTKIAAGKDQIEAHLEELAKVAPLPAKMAREGEDAYELLASVVAGEFAEAAVRLNAISGAVQTTSVAPSEGKKGADEVIDVSDYREVPNEAS